MRRALALAARGHTPPNPMVGCVIVRDGQVVGEGWHHFAGQPHAEVEALAVAGESAQGADVYVTLEPHAHHGRTPPCTDALIRAGVRRVFVATLDVNPKVSGQGITQLLEAGLAVEVGMMAKDAEELNHAFLHFHRTGNPHVTLKSAVSLDGKIATHTGDSKWITGEKARHHVHEMRARAGAVMTGVGTVLADDPSLTARIPGTKLPRQPLRVIIDSHLRTPLDAKSVQLAKEDPSGYPLLIFATSSASKRRVTSFKEIGVEIMLMEEVSRVALNQVMTELARREVISVLVEAGGTLNASLLVASLVNRVTYFIAPKIIGGVATPTAVEGLGIVLIKEALELGQLHTKNMGDDIMVWADVISSRS